MTPQTQPFAAFHGRLPAPPALHAAGFAAILPLPFQIFSFSRRGIFGFRRHCYADISAIISRQLPLAFAMRRLSPLMLMLTLRCRHFRHAFDG
jgi:hypothetical protein